MAQLTYSGTRGVYISGPGSSDMTLGGSPATANTFTDTLSNLVQPANAADDVLAYFNDWGVKGLIALENKVVHAL